MEKLPPTPDKHSERDTAIEWMEKFSEALCSAKKKAEESLTDKQKRADNRKVKWPMHWDTETRELARKKERLREKFLLMRKMMKAHNEPEEKSIGTLKEVERQMK